MNKAESPPPPLPHWLTGKQGKQSRTSRTKAREASVNQSMQCTWSELF